MASNFEGTIKDVKATVESNTNILELVLQTLQSLQSLSLKMERKFSGVQTELDSLHQEVAALSSREPRRDEEVKSQGDRAVSSGRQESFDGISTQIQGLATSLNLVDKQVYGMSDDLTSQKHTLTGLADDMRRIKRSSQANDLKVSKLLRMYVHGHAQVTKDLANAQENSASLVIDQVNDLKDFVDEQLPHVDQLMLKVELGEQFSDLKELGKQQLGDVTNCIGNTSSNQPAEKGSYNTSVLRNAKISTEGIVSYNNQTSSYSVAQCKAAHSFTEDCHSFSIEIISTTREGQIGIGGCTSDYPQDKYPGNNPGSIVYNAGEGGVYYKGQISYLCEESRSGDVLTMTFDVKTRKITFLKNKKMIYATTWPDSIYLYPTIAMNYDGQSVRLLEELSPWRK